VTWKYTQYGPGLLKLIKGELSQVSLTVWVALPEQQYCAHVIYKLQNCPKCVRKTMPWQQTSHALHAMMAFTPAALHGVHVLLAVFVQGILSSAASLSS
jgi:hypothetical protein